MKLGTIVRAIDQYSIEEQDWWDCMDSYQNLASVLAPIIKSTIGTISGQEDDDEYYAVDFNVMIPLKLKLYFRECELEEMK